jgi:hypothetical protein
MAMRKTWMAALAVGAATAAGAGCSNDPYIGTWNTTSMVTAMLFGLSQTTNSSGTVAIAAGTGGVDYKVTVNQASDGGSLGCTLDATKSNGGFTIKSGQMCNASVFAAEMPVGLMITMVSGTGSLSGTTLTVTLQGSLSGMYNGVPLTGGTATATISGGRATTTM